MRDWALYSVRVDDLGRKNILDLQPTLGQPLLLVIAQERLNGPVIRLHSVRPVVIAHFMTGFLDVGGQPRDRDRVHRWEDSVLLKNALLYSDEVFEQVQDAAAKPFVGGRTAGCIKASISPLCSMPASVWLVPFDSLNLDARRQVELYFFVSSGLFLTPV